MTTVLTTQDLRVRYGRGRKALEVLKGISVEIKEGETLGLVGESGSGKSTLGRAILGLAPISSGSVHFCGEDITHAGAGRRRQLATALQVVFQDPYSSLNPSMTIRDILTEPLIAQGIGRKKAVLRIGDLLDRVGMPSDSLDRFSREFSGGQRQRVAMARALAFEPKLIVCDEPVSALDLSTQSRVLDLFIELQERTGVSYMFISHDLSVVRHVSHNVAVMYQGEIVEIGPATQVTDQPSHPYTQRLWAASLVADPVAQAARRAKRQELQAATSDVAPSAER